jgi:ferredoxin-thioredoxin reductase catalytic chain
LNSRPQAAQDLYARLKSEAEAAGYYLNPDVEFVLDLMEGLLANQERYGYQSCPCRLAVGQRAADRDIICPCDYRDPDLDEYGACYCALYVSEASARGDEKLQPVPERRGAAPAPAEHEEKAELVGITPAGMAVWRCTVCGYLCARSQPPLKCPVCKADRDRFARFVWGHS